MEETLVSRLRIHEDAVLEFDAAIAWYNERQTGLGLALHAAVQFIFDRIVADPHSGLMSERSEYRFLKTPRFPYVVYWLEQDDTLWVIAIAHTRQVPYYWKHRTRSE